MVMESLAKRITKYREALQLSKSELAEKAVLTPAAISQFESGEREPSLESLKKLAEALEVKVSHLVGEESDTDFQDDPELSAMFRGAKKLNPENKKKLQDMYQVFLKWSNEKPKK